MARMNVIAYVALCITACKDRGNRQLLLRRYYLNRFRDAYRQASIDCSLGEPISEQVLSTDEVDASEEEDANLVQQVRLVIEDCKRLLIPDAQTIIGAWGLIDADPG